MSWSFARLLDVISFPFFVGFAERSSRHTWNISSIEWVIYFLYGQLVSSSSACLGHVPKNIAKYHSIINLLSTTISLEIRCIFIHLDSQLIVFWLNNAYHGCDSTLLWKYLWVKVLERNFVAITYIHISRSENHISDALTNYVLDWHINHEKVKDTRHAK